ncbi:MULTISPECIES: hypothetical protein [Acinetobacter]|uniref:Uncharacterized protein n=1 Tax=Acinetobacter entericus TaxID=2989714 RepID=A0ABT3NKI5_9GAMM|nr:MULTISPECIES: hypothetical protein [Acinetobacter]MCW8040069.1 hypothetical protein [Acinetobacter entericus]TCB76771.1 hypothetical protein E0H91_00455 [Acinetobacter sp. ANC 4177]
MSEIVGIIIFYIFILLGLFVAIYGLLAVDYLLFPIGVFLIIIAFLLKLEFKVPVLFWKNDD